MKNRILDMDGRTQTKLPTWLYQEVQEDDFLLGKTPIKIQDTWDDEE
jgi:hypothetical protein